MPIQDRDESGPKSLGEKKKKGLFHASVPIYTKHKSTKTSVLNSCGTHYSCQILPLLQ